MSATGHKHREGTLPSGMKYISDRDVDVDRHGRKTGVSKKTTAWSSPAKGMKVWRGESDSPHSSHQKRSAKKVVTKSSGKGTRALDGDYKTQIVSKIGTTPGGRKYEATRFAIDKQKPIKDTIVSRESVRDQTMAQPQSTKNNSYRKGTGCIWMVAEGKHRHVGSRTTRVKKGPTRKL